MMVEPLMTIFVIIRPSAHGETMERSRETG